MKIFRTKNDYYTQLKNVWEIRTKKYGIRVQDRQLKFVFSNTEGENAIYIDEKNNSMSVNCVNITEEWLEENHKYIHDYAPKYVIGYASVIFNFVRLYEKLGISFPQTIKYIELLGEYVFDFQKKYIKEITGANVVNSYGTSEVFGIAYECEMGRLHCVNKNALVEVVSDDMRKCNYGEKGNILLTAYHSAAMPFIRYKIGDVGTLHKGSNCTCGNPNDILELNAGRIYDYILLENGEKKHAGFLYGIISTLNKKFCDCILQFEIIQEAYDKFLVNLSIKKQYGIFNEIIKRDFVKLVKQYELGKVEWRFNVVVGEALDMGTGKYKFFKRNINL